MIQLDEIHIEELRGIRKLTLPLNRKSFAIQGPNGSGKSGVVDAIEFGLTGDMSRLTGRGTAGLTVKSHGPHIDSRDYPDSAFVRLTVFLPQLNKVATIVRKAKKPTEPIITPDDPDIKAVLSLVSEHPEITLTRRQIIRLILTEATSRSKDVQTLLRLDSIYQVRATLKTASNRTSSNFSSAQTATRNAADALRRHLDTPKLGTTELLAVINKHRAVLGLEPLAKLAADTSLKEGVADTKPEGQRLNKQTSIRDIQALAAHHKVERESDPAKRLLTCLAKLKQEPDLLTMLQRRSFLQTGLNFVTDDSCPLCDTAWNAGELRQHLTEKLKRSETAKAIEEELRLARQELDAEIDSLLNTIATVTPVAVVLRSDASHKSLDSWKVELTQLKTHIQTFEGAELANDRLSAGWFLPPKDAIENILKLETAVAALPDKSASLEAYTFLTIAQERLEAYRNAQRHEKRMERAAKIAGVTYKKFCEAAEKVLEALYKQVQSSFAELYRIINHDDEGDFTAKLSPADGKLDLVVDFHKRGMFPPGAYHSEGHQDGMGLCLYLALMKQLLGEQFSLAVLDDVVMSVDNQHRKELCQLLKASFPKTQFIITTHEQAWFQQMRSAGLVDRSSCKVFRSWTVEDGPLVDDAKDAWEKMDEHLKKDEVSEAAAILRRHLEFVAHELASNLGAMTPHRPEGGHELGELLPSVVGRFKSLLGKAADSAQAWKNDSAKAALSNMKNRFAECTVNSNVEQWAVNSAVHYNTWADFVRQDFQPVVTAFKDLLSCFSCPACKSWLHICPRRGNEETLRCDCSKISFNLAKPDKPR